MMLQNLLEKLVFSASLRGLAQGTLRALAIGTAAGLIVCVLELASGATTRQYRSRGFLHDVVYWFYYASGLNRLLLLAAVFNFLGPRLAFLHIRAVDSMPLVLRGTLWILLADFTSYWVHRLQHASRWVWAFHSTHHSQEDLNFATTTRFHPVDHFISDVLKFVPPLMLGASPLSWLPLYVIMLFISMTQHSRIRWRFGPLPWILVTPRFHSFHHSTDPRHHDKNFGALFSFWDHLFGTAVDAVEQPCEYGLTDIKMPTLLSTLLLPFQLLRQTHGPVSGSSSPVSPPVEEVPPTG